jgi:hypothetical protein
MQRLHSNNHSAVPAHTAEQSTWGAAVSHGRCCTAFALQRDAGSNVIAVDGTLHPDDTRQVLGGHFQNVERPDVQRCSSARRRQRGGSQRSFKPQTHTKRTARVAQAHHGRFKYSLQTDARGGERGRAPRGADADDAVRGQRWTLYKGHMAGRWHANQQWKKDSVAVTPRSGR